ncbi:MAG TPA: phospholipase D-like domain-containing protein [Steroidobacteraceae bacterium]
MKRRLRRLLLVALVAGWLVMAYWQTVKPLPQGTHVAGPVCPAAAAQVSFIADITAADAYGRLAVSQAIFDEVLKVVRGARHFIVLDYALLGAAAGAQPQRALAAELTDALLAARRTQPELKVLLVTDPVNERYGASRSSELTLLRAAGVEVVLARLDALRDANFLYSSLWRLTVGWWDGPRGPLGFKLRQLNFKGDHRKVVIADDGGEALVAVVGSANPEDAQSGWSNLAARVSGDSLGALLASELAIARFSGWTGDSEPYLRAADPRSPEQCSRGVPAAPAAVPLSADTARVQVLTEGALRRALLEHAEASARGDAIDVAMFGFADRGVIEALLDASRRGVEVRLILDPSEDAATAASSGVPNQPAASELVARSAGAVRVRWYRTHGERFHGALVLFRDRQKLWLTVGSANLTRRGLDDYNLEASLAIEVLRDAPLAGQVQGYFDTLWGNRAALGIEYTADFAAFADSRQTDYWLYRLLEGAGFTAF